MFQHMFFVVHLSIHGYTMNKSIPLKYIFFVNNLLLPCFNVDLKWNLSKYIQTEMFIYQMQHLVARLILTNFLFVQ